MSGSTARQPAIVTIALSASRCRPHPGSVVSASVASAGAGSTGSSAVTDSIAGAGASTGRSLSGALAPSVKSGAWPASTSHQAATALFGCTALIVAISIPFLMFMGGEISQAAGLSSPRMTLLLISSVWNFAVVIYILKETLEISAIMTFVITLAIELAVGSVLVQLFGNRLL